MACQNLMHPGACKTSFGPCNIGELGLAYGLFMVGLTRAYTPKAAGVTSDPSIANYI